MLNVTYTDGSQCRIPATGPADQCHARAAGDEGGSIPTSLPNTAVHAAYLPSAGNLEAPLIAPARGTPANTMEAFRPAVAGEETAGPAASVSFIAPVAAPNASTAYVVELTPQGSARLRDPVADRLPAQQPRHRRRPAGCSWPSP